MKKCVLLIPTRYNDGRKVEDYKLENALNEIANLTGGYTIDGEVIGAYKMNSGTIQREVSRKLWIVCENEIIDKLKTLVLSLKKQFQQECMYFSVTDETVMFL